MAESPVFEWAAEQLEVGTSLQRLQARGIMRLAVKEAGLESRALAALQLEKLVDHLLPKILQRNGIADSEALLQVLRVPPPELDSGLAQSADDVFRRLGGDGAR